MLKRLFLLCIFLCLMVCPIKVLSNHLIKYPPSKIILSEIKLDSILLNVLYLFNQRIDNKQDIKIRSDTMVLSIGNDWSIYYDWNRKKRDSISGRNLAMDPVYRNISLRVNPEELQARFDMNELVYHLADASKGESAKIFKLRSEKKIITIDDHSDIFYRLQEQPLFHEWIITNDTLTILDYVCQNALTEFRGRIYSVWFTTDIPINEGPWKLYGLPGMILKAEDSEKIFCFEAIGLNKVKDQFINMVNSKNIVVCENFHQLQKVRQNRFRHVFYGFVEGGNLVYYPSNNPIELIELEK